MFLRFHHEKTLIRPFDVTIVIQSTYDFYSSSS